MFAKSLNGALKILQWLLINSNQMNHKSLKVEDVILRTHFHQYLRQTVWHIEILHNNDDQKLE